MYFWRIWFTANCLILIGLVTRLDAGVLSLDGTSHVELANPSGVFPIGNDSFTIEAWINPTSIPAGGGAGGQITFWGNQSGNQANGFRMAGDAGVVHYFWGNDHGVSGLGDMLDDSTGPNGDGWHHVAISYDGDSSQSTWYKDGEIIGTANQTRNAGANVADANYRIGSRLNGEFFHGYIDELRVWSSARSDSEILSNFDSQINPSSSDLVAYYQFEGAEDFSDSTENANDGTPIGVGAIVDTGIDSPAEVQLDADEDGIPDFWEDENDVDDPDGDPDNDGLSNAAEYAAKTNPNAEDSDKDGLGDAAEINDHNTDPTSADTDGDGLEDGEEVNGTNGFTSDPNLIDTDNDFVNDFAEAEGGTDPNDPTDPVKKGGVLELDGQVANFVTFNNDSGLIPIGASSFTIEAWINPTSIPAGGGSGGQITFWGNQSGQKANGFRMAGNQGLRHYFWGNDHDANTSEDMLSDTTGLNGDGWHHVAISYDDDTNSSTLFHNGISVGTKVRTTDPNVDDANYLIGKRISGEPFHGFIDELRIWNVSRTDEEIVENFELEISGEENLVSYWNFNAGLTDITGNGHDGIAVGSASINRMLNAPVSSSASLEITEVTYDLSGDEVTIVWSSRSGRTYAIDYSEDLMDWSEIDDGIAADGDSTEFTDILPPGTMMRFWRVREMDP